MLGDSHSCSTGSVDWTAPFITSFPSSAHVLEKGLDDLQPAAGMGASFALKRKHLKDMVCASLSVCMCVSSASSLSQPGDLQLYGTTKLPSQNNHQITDDGCYSTKRLEALAGS